ncbi:hypothetical protein ACFE04_006755 [Oxalis oulophora]
MELYVPRMCRVSKNCKTRRHDRKIDHNDCEHVKTSFIKGKTESKSWGRKTRARKNEVGSSSKRLKKFRDGYVNVMVSFAGNFAQLNNGNVYLFQKLPKPEGQE